MSHAKVSQMKNKCAHALPLPSGATLPEKHSFITPLLKGYVIITNRPEQQPFCQPLTLIKVPHMFINSFLFFPDYNGREIMQLPGLNIYDREIGNNPLIGHAHPFHQGCLVEKVQLM